MSLSTHVLDAVTGHPAAGIRVRLERRGDTRSAPLAVGVTDPDGRIGELAVDLAAGDYCLVFDTETYLSGRTFYPEVVITFRITDPADHYHVPLLLSPYAFSTYRGS